MNFTAQEQLLFALMRHHVDGAETGGADLQDERIGCILVGPGLGDVPQVLTLALTAPRPIVIDADCLLRRDSKSCVSTTG